MVFFAAARMAEHQELYAVFRSEELAGWGVEELGEGHLVCLPIVPPLDWSRWYRFDGGGGLDDGS